MTTDSITQAVTSVQSIQTIVMGLAIAEAFKQSVKELRPVEETHAVTFRDWFECIHRGRLVSLLAFLLLAVSFFLGNQKYLYSQYIEPLHGPNPPERVSAFWLNLDGLVFVIEAGLFFVMSRSLSACRWQQFYATLVILMLLDFVWVVAARWHGINVPTVWIWFDLGFAVICSAVIAIDRLFMQYERGKELNVYCFAAISLITIIWQIFSYFIYQVDYLVGQ